MQEGIVRSLNLALFLASLAVRDGTWTAVGTAIPAASASDVYQRREGWQLVWAQFS